MRSGIGPSCTRTRQNWIGADAPQSSSLSVCCCFASSEREVCYSGLSGLGMRAARPWLASLHTPHVVCKSESCCGYLSKLESLRERQIDIYPTQYRTAVRVRIISCSCELAVIDTVSTSSITGYFFMETTGASFPLVRYECRLIALWYDY